MKTTSQMVEIRNIKKTYRMGELQVPVLQGINLNIDRGAYHAILGESGCGKTTLLNLLGALDIPDSGSLLIDGQDIAKFDETARGQYRQQKVGFIFQFFNLLPLLTALENVELGLEATGKLTKQQITEQSVEMLTRVGLARELHKFPSQLSGGQQQRVAIARALAKRPSLLLCDEPTGNLDARTGHSISELMLELNKTLGLTLVVVTHSSDLARQASHVTTLVDGQVSLSRQAA